MKRLLIAAFMLMTACGTATTDPAGTGGGGGVPPTGTGGGDDFGKIKPVLDANCGRCHNGVTQKPAFDSAASFRGSKAKARILNGSMPPGGGMSDADKQTLLNFLG